MKIKVWIITLIVIALVLLGLYSYKQYLMSPSGGASAGDFEPAATVEATETKMSVFQNTVQVTGNIKAPQQLILKNELAGKITGLFLTSGEIVKKGKTLLTLDTSNEEASLIAAKARVTLSEQTLKRYKNLVSRNEISAELVDKATSDLAIATSEVMSLNTKIEKKTITAPFDAVVGLHNLTQGQYLDSNSQIADLVGVTDHLWVEFSLPQSFSELAINETVMINSSNGLALSANIIAVEPVLTSQSRHLTYRAQFSVKNNAIKPNSLVNVVAPISDVENRISIPDVALTHDQFGDYVFILTPEEGGQGSYRAKRKQVTIALKNETDVVLKNGLEEGQTIATLGAFKLRDGMKVFIAKAAPTAEQ
ncbi:efflux RND transporter periplasmic adaptor subunit [Colwellia sp. RE-S-Sl-9]